MLYIMIEHQTTAILRDPLSSTFLGAYFVMLTMLTFIIPLISLLVMKRSEIISSLQLPDREERIPVMVLVIIYYIITYYLFDVRNEEFNYIFGSFMSFLSGGLIISVISLLITFKWKISLHAIGISGMAGAFLGMTELLYPINNFEEIRGFNTVLLLLVGIICSSRLVLKAHSFSQILGGIILGGVVEYLVVSNAFTF